jgi:hypothetical protein
MSLWNDGFSQNMHKIISKIIVLASKKWLDKKLCFTVKKIFSD